MLFNENLEEIIFHRHQIIEADELIILSGYVGPNPIEKLAILPFRTQVVYGMYGSEGIKQSLHNSLIALQKSIQNIDIFYSNLPIHSKCYLWKYKNEVVHALVGSANFSSNGLRTPFREILAETTRDTFSPLNNYIQRILSNSISCLELNNVITLTETELCTLTLLKRNGEIHDRAGGLNWGQNPNNHTRPNDAYIPIRTEHIKKHPDLFPPKQIDALKDNTRGKIHRDNDAIEIIWDDGISMEGLLEGSQTINNIVYPKQISSFPVKSQLGEYFRRRLKVPLGQPVRKHHLESYGRTDVTISKLSEGVYRLDFSV